MALNNFSLFDGFQSHIFLSALSCHMIISVGFQAGRSRLPGQLPLGFPYSMIHPSHSTTARYEWGAMFP